jgi:hypothetical protein
MGALAALAGLFVLLAQGCGRQEPDIVAQASGWKLRTSDVIRAHERLYPKLPFAETPCDRRVALLQNLVNNELLLGLARRDVRELGWPRERKVRSERERELVDLFFRQTWGEFHVGPEDRRRALEGLSRQAHLLRIVPADQASADSCHAALQQGMSFEEAYEKYAVKLGSVATDLDMGWVTPETLPHKVIRHVFMPGMAPGEVTPPCFTPRGVWIIKVLEYAPAEFLPSQMRLIDEAIRILCYRDTLTTRSERLRQSLDLSYNEENFPVVNRALSAYWDSLSANTPRANRIAMYSWRAPTWNLAATDRDLPLFRFSGRTVSVFEFLRSLNDCDVEFWPGGPTREHRRQEILARIQRFLVVAEAERQGLPQQPEFRALEQRLRDEGLLDEFFASRIEPEIIVTPEDVRAQYEGAREGYRGHEKAAFTVMTFPPNAHAEVLAFRAAHAHDTVRDWGLAAVAAADRDTTVVFYRDRGVMDLEKAPETLLHQVVFPVLVNLELDQVSEPVELPNGGWALVRCNYRRHTAPLPEEVALQLAEGDVRRIKTDQKVEQLLAQARQSRRLRMWPARLCTDQAPSTGAGQ